MSVSILAATSLAPDPDASADGPGGATVFWGVADASAAFKRLLGFGAREHTVLEEVGEGIRVVTVLHPLDNVFGIIENPRFKLSANDPNT